jgi:putative hydroxymethylpyrimidine transport system substrate-binding protein
MGAYWTHETILAEQQGHPVDVMRVEDWGVPDYYELVLTASETTVKERPAVVTAFLGAMQHGYEDAIADQSAALDALQKDYPDMDRDVETQGLALLAPEWTDQVPVFGAQTPERWNAFGDWMKQHNLISADLDISAAYTTVLLPGPSATPEATPNG